MNEEYGQTVIGFDDCGGRMARYGGQIGVHGTREEVLAFIDAIRALVVDGAPAGTDTTLMFDPYGAHIWQRTW